MRTITAIAALAIATPAMAQQADMSAFKPGPVLEDFGPHAPVPGRTEIPEGTVFRIAFDTSQAAPDGKENRTLASAARFLNMHVAASVPESDIHLAVVLHGKAVFDVLTEEAWAAKKGADSPNETRPLLRALLDHEVRVILCGQSAAAYGIGVADLEPGVEMALSAMTAHALLAGEGYSGNPF